MAPVRIDAGGSTVGILAAAGAVWAVADTSSELLRIDTSSNKVTKRVHLGGSRSLFLAAGAGSLWVSVPGTLVAVDPVHSVVRRRITVGYDARDVLVAAGSVWVTDPLESSVVRVAPATGKVVKRIEHVGAEPNGLAFAHGHIWAGDYTGGHLYRIDPHTNRIAGSTPLPGADWITVAPGALWVSQEQVNAVARVDPATARVVGRVHVGANPLGSVLVGSDLWV